MYFLILKLYYEQLVNKRTDRTDNFGEKLCTRLETRSISCEWSNKRILGHLKCIFFDCNISFDFKNNLKASFTLPLDSAPQFQSLFEILERSSKSIGVEYFAISMTNLEEVFLKLGEIEDSHQNQAVSVEDVNIKRESINHSSQTMITQKVNITIYTNFEMNFYYLERFKRTQRKHPK